MSIDPSEGVLESVGDLDDATQALVVREFLPTRQLELSANISSGAKEEVEVSMPFDGYVLGVYLRVPDGVDGRVGLSLRSETQADRVFPSGRGKEEVAFNGIDRFFPVVFEQAAGGDLTFTYDSRSSTAHFINALVEVVDTTSISGVIP
jgi:hypothetical protein